MEWLAKAGDVVARFFWIDVMMSLVAGLLISALALFCTRPKEGA